MSGGITALQQYLSVMRILCYDANDKTASVEGVKSMMAGKSPGEGDSLFFVGLTNPSASVFSIAPNVNSPYGRKRRFSLDNICSENEEPQDY